MEQNYFLISSVLLVIIIASFINHYDLSATISPDLIGEFCNDFQAAFPGCWCKAENSFIHDFSTDILTESLATNIIDNYYNSINQTCSNPECFDLGSGFYNCFCSNEHLGTLRTNGEFYLTECGV
ncbi:MAG: hypothetical protein WC376_05950 [Candidatus Nanoarchaeia archaeon]|jgi:hypothetical protein